MQPLNLHCVLGGAHEISPKAASWRRFLYWSGLHPFVLTASKMFANVRCKISLTRLLLFTLQVYTQQASTDSSSVHALCHSWCLNPSLSSPLQCDLLPLLWLAPFVVSHLHSLLPPHRQKVETNAIVLLVPPRIHPFQKRGLPLSSFPCLALSFTKKLYCCFTKHGWLLASSICMSLCCLLFVRMFETKKQRARSFASIRLVTRKMMATSCGQKSQ